jgi:aminoglycoside phosphotransferase (APT) family kinase protein
MPGATDLVTVDADRLTGWIADRLPGTGPLRLERMGQATGVGNALFILSRAAEPQRRWVLRRPPAVVNAPGASDMLREWRLLTALEGTSVPHPRPLVLCDDAEVIGAPFLVMDVVDGFTPVGALPAPYDRPDGRRALGLALVDAIADLSAVDWRAGGLEGLGRPEGFLERQVGRWLRQLELYRTRDIPMLENVASWLEANRPTMGVPGIMHGDYSPYNVMASRTDRSRLAAVIDWDTGTIGDPLLDIGHLLARWTEPGEESALGLEIEAASREGLPRRAEMAERYAERTGRDLSALPYYQALSLFKLGIILEGRVARAPSPAEAGERAELVNRLIRFADLFARGERT